MKWRMLDLFSGIGGFSLAASWVWGDDLEIVAFCEIDKFCQEVLHKHWPDVPTIPDIRDIYRFADEYGECPDCGEPYCERHNKHFAECACVGCSQWDDEYGTIDLIAGGDPCQAHSNACRAADPLHESMAVDFLRIISAMKPRFVLRENPAAVKKGVYDWKKFCTELESFGYYTIPIRARACCVGAAQKRERVFVLAAFQKSDIERLERYERKILENPPSWRYYTDAPRSIRRNPTSRICGRTDGVPNRVDRLKALGNAIVPQVAMMIMQAIKEASGE